MNIKSFVLLSLLALVLIVATVTATEDTAAGDFPEIKILPVKDVLESVKAVMHGKADATIAEISVVQDVISRNMLTGVRL